MSSMTAPVRRSGGDLDVYTGLLFAAFHRAARPDVLSVALRQPRPGRRALRRPVRVTVPDRERLPRRFPASTSSSEAPGRAEGRPSSPCRHPSDPSDAGDLSTEGRPRSLFGGLPSGASGILAERQWQPIRPIGGHGCHRVDRLAPSSTPRTPSPHVLRFHSRLVQRRHGHRPRHLQHPGLRARRGHRPERAVGGRRPQGDQPGHQQRHRRRLGREGHARQDARVHLRRPAAQGRRHQRLRDHRGDAQLLHPQGQRPEPHLRAPRGHRHPLRHHRGREARRARLRGAGRVPERSTSSRSRWPRESAPVSPSRSPLRA